MGVDIRRAGGVGKTGFARDFVRRPRNPLVSLVLFILTAAARKGRKVAASRVEPPVGDGDNPGSASNGVDVDPRRKDGSQKRTRQWWDDFRKTSTIRCVLRVIGLPSVHVVSSRRRYYGVKPPPLVPQGTRRGDSSRVEMGPMSRTRGTGVELSAPYAPAVSSWTP